jgi:hypothetical protein
MKPFNKKNNWDGDRVKKSQSAKEALLERWKNRSKTQQDIGKHGRAEHVKGPKSDHQLAPEQLDKPTECAAPKYGHSGLCLYKGGDTPHVPGHALRSLINVYLRAAANSSAHVALVWPGGLRPMLLAHVFATAEYWAQGDKRGVRGGYYPAKNNTFFPFNHLMLSRSCLKHWAQTLVENPRKPNPKVTGSLPEKDVVYFRIGNTSEARACINEVIPHFERQAENQNWEDYSAELLGHFLTKVRRHTEKAALRGQLCVLGKPGTAPDAIFALGYRLSKADLKKALRSMQEHGLPRVVMIDATRNIRMTVDGWRSKIFGFLEVFFEEFATDRPGLVVVTDDPRIGWQLREAIQKKSKKALGNEVRVSFNPIASTRHGDGLISEEIPEDLAIDPKKFKVLIRDAEASQVIGRLQKVMQALNQPESAKPLKAAGNFLMKLSALPASLNVLLQWLDERQADMRFRDQFLWASHKANLQQFVESGQAGTECGQFEKARSAADKLVTDYHGGTAIAHALAHEVDAAAKSTTHIALVFTRPVVKILAERFLAEQEYADGQSLADFSQRVRMMLICDLDRATDFTESWADRYIFVGADDEIIRFLVSDNRIPNDSRLLLTYRVGVYLLSALKPIHDLEEFRRFKPRIDQLIDQLQEQLGADERSILHSDDLLMPSFNFSAAVSAGAGANEHDTRAWRIVLEDGQVLWRGETSHVYVYDPTSEHASDSGFHLVETKSLDEGSLVFVMSEDLSELVEDHLKKSGMTVSSDKPFETALRQYHELVMRKLGELFPDGTRTAQVEAIRRHILQTYPDMKDFPSNIAHWISLGESANTPFEDLRPHAPRKYPHYKAFAETLGFDPTQVMWYWQCAIHPIRVNRRVDGRFISDIYSKILFDPESAIVHSGLSRKVTDALYEKARDNVYTITSIQRPIEPSV